MASRVFDSLKAKRGRIYPMTSDERKRWVEGKQGFSWWNDKTPQEKKEMTPHMQGMLKIDQEVVDTLQEAVNNHGGAFPWKLEVIKVATEDGSNVKQLNLDTWIPRPQNAEGQTPSSPAQQDADFINEAISQFLEP